MNFLITALESAIKLFQQAISQFQKKGNSKQQWFENSLFPIFMYYY